MIWQREKMREKTGRRFTLLFAGLNLTTQPASSQLRAKRRRFVPHRTIPCEPPSLARPLLFWGVFATLYLAGLASPTGPGLGRPAPSGTTALVCAYVVSEPGSGEAVFVIEEAAGLRG